MSVNGKALAAVTLGGLLVWSGVKGFSVLGTLNDLILGNGPQQTERYPLGDNGSGGGAADVGNVPSTGQAPIASIALGYLGHAYRFGGAPGVNAQNPWDCSSMVNYVVGVKSGHAIPGYAPGAYHGTTHGPSTPQWAIWNGLTSLDRREVSSGDIIVWAGHMGIAVDNDRYVSALNPTSTTRVETIDGFGHTPVRMGRLR
jgi:cell wall-associated NlpC family hydrolase